MYVNLNAAWLVMLEDSAPELSNDPAEFTNKVIPHLRTIYTEEAIEDADKSLGEHRVEDDINDLDSPLWSICCGGDDEESASLIESLDPDTNSILNEMFDFLGVI